MPNIRKFYLESAAGERFGLNGERGVYFTSPEGLGFETETEYLSLGGGFFSPLLDEDEPDLLGQTAVVGTLAFDRPAYQNYRAFADWISAAGSLRLIYAPAGEAEASRAVAVSSLQKGELDKTRLLFSPVELLPLSPWERGSSAALTAGASARASRYSGRYPGRYGQDAAGRLSVRLAPAGHLPGAVLLRYYGGITDPEIRLTGARTGKVYALASLSGTVPVTAVLEYSSRPDAAFIRKLNADGSSADLLGALADPAPWPYARLPLDEDCLFTVSSAVPFNGSADLTVYHYFRTV